MSRIKGKNTKPEMTVRSIIHGMGFRYRLHHKDLPGRPDIVLSRYKKIVFVHGCFWHGHVGCPRSKPPETNKEFWTTKLNKNVERDRRYLDALREMGWQVLVVWQCEISKPDELIRKLERFLYDQE